MWWKKAGFLGSGSYGTVSLAVPGHSSSAWFSSPSSVAVKSAKIDHSDSLRREEGFLYSLRGNPNFIHCYGTDPSLEDDGETVYNLLLEYAAGGSLQSLIKSRQGEMSKGEVAFYAYQLLEGLADLHALGIVHCDLKPQNILVFPNQKYQLNSLKIADFGLAIYDSGKVKEEINNKYVCRGTLPYISPESLYGIQKAPRDVWALGCITTEMITGKPVWENCCNTADLVAKIETQEPKIPEDVSVLCKDFLNKCLNRNSKGRWSAEKLMAHPFFLRNSTPVVYYWTEVMDCDYELPENPFGDDDQWVNNKDLFSMFNRNSHYDCMDDDEN